MTVVGVILFVLGLGAIVGGLLAKGRAGRITNTPFGTTGGVAQGAIKPDPKGAISTQGQVQVQDTLTSPVTQQPCVYYQLRITCEYKVGDKTRTDVIQEERRAVPFWVDDGSGRVAVDAGKGGDFDVAKTLKQTRRKGLGSAMSGMLEFGDKGFRIPAGGSFNGYVIPDHAAVTVHEEVVPTSGLVYVNGKLEGGAIVSPTWRALLLSGKPRDELLAAAEKSAKLLLNGGAAGAGVGAVVALIGRIAGL